MLNKKYSRILSTEPTFLTCCVALLLSVARCWMLILVCRFHDGQESEVTRLIKAIWQQAASPWCHILPVRYIVPRHFPKIWPFPFEGSGSNLIHGSLRSPDPPRQTASQLNQPFFYSIHSLAMDGQNECGNRQVPTCCVCYIADAKTQPNNSSSNHVRAVKNHCHLYWKGFICSCCVQYLQGAKILHNYLLEKPAFIAVWYTVALEKNNCAIILAPCKNCMQ